MTAVEMQNVNYRKCIRNVKNVKTDRGAATSFSWAFSDLLKIRPIK
jgi:hypothetical protein